MVRTFAILASCILSTNVAAADPPSPARAAALSAAPFGAGLALAVGGLIVANQRTCTTSQTGGSTCTDHYDSGVGMTIAGGVLVAVGPSLGHVYAGHVWTTGLKIRLAGLGLAGAGFAGLLLSDHSCTGFVCTKDVIGIGAVIIGGGVVVVGGAIDVTQAGEAAARASGPQLALTPIRTPSSTVLGLSARGTF
jgi:hypothetical protein